MKESNETEQDYALRFYRTIANTCLLIEGTCVVVTLKNKETGELDWRTIFPQKESPK